MHCHYGNKNVLPPVPTVKRPNYRHGNEGVLPESWLDLDSERLTAEASRDWSIMPMLTLCL